MTTSPLLQLDAVSTVSLRDLSCRALPGQILRFICSVQEEREQLWRVLTAAEAPRRGGVQIAGRDPFALGERERLGLFQRIGTVAHDGGLIGNLRAWENVLLPASYHRTRGIAEIEAGVVALFGEFGVEGESLRGLMRRLPDRLSPIERRWVAIARAITMEPDIIIYDAPFTGVEREAAARMLRALLQFHRERADRVSVFLLPEESFSERVPADLTILLGAESS